MRNNYMQKLLSLFVTKKLEELVGVQFVGVHPCETFHLYFPIRRLQVRSNSYEIKENSGT
jgi:hypothetical protein